MHVGEKPYVVLSSASTSALRGPLAWGQVELSSRPLTASAMSSMLTQMLTDEQRRTLDELGAIEEEIAAPGESGGRFVVTAARGGDDVWVEVRRRKETRAAAVEVPEEISGSDEAIDLTEPQPVSLAEPVVEVGAITSTGVESIDLSSELDRAEAKPPVDESVLAERIAALEREAADSLAAREAELLSEAEASLAARHAELEAETARVLSEKQTALVARMDERIAAREAELLERMEAELAAKTRELASHADASLTAKQAEINEQLQAAIAARESAFRDELQQAIALKERELTAQADAALAEKEAALRTQIESAEAARAAVARAEAEVAAIAQRTEAALAEREAAMKLEADAVRASVEAAAAADVERILALKTAEIAAQAEQAVAEREAALKHASEAVIADRQAIVAAEAERVLAEKRAALEAEARRAAQDESERVAELQRALAAKESALSAQAVRLAEKEDALAAEVQRALAEKENAIAEARRLAEKAVALSVETQRAFVEKEQAMAAESRRALAERESALTEDMHRTLAARESALAEEMQRAIAAREAAVVGEAERRLAEREASIEENRRAVAEREATLTALQRDLVGKEAALAAEARRIAEREARIAQNEREPNAGAVVTPIARAPLKLQPPQPVIQVAASTEASLVELLRAAAEHGASMVYAVVDTRPMMRLAGEIAIVGTQAPVAAGDVERFIFQFAPRELVADATPEWTCTVPDVGRVRCVAFQDHSGAGLIFHLPSRELAAADDLSLGDELRALCDEADGLIVVAGPRSTGKSALLSEFVDVINSTRYDHVITIESQIRRVHEKRLSFISQREVRGDGDAIAKAARTALREGPDVLVIEDLRAPEALVAALDAARAGRLVFGSISAPTTPGAVERLIDAFPADRRSQVRASLAGALRAVVAQILVPKISGGRIAAREVLLSSPAVRKVILDGAISQLPIAIESGRSLGMRTMVDALGRLVRDGIVSIGAACTAAPDRLALISALERDGIDVSGVEKRA